MMEKTNAMRILDKKKINYQFHDYVDSGAISGVEVANYLKQPLEKVFKTLVTVSKSNNHYVFLVPVAKELDLKKAAKAVNEKAVSMLKSSELFQLTGYVHGGCSPVGMKKQFKTVIDESVNNLETFCMNGGKIGYQVELSLKQLQEVIKIECFDIVKEM